MEENYLYNKEEKRFQSPEAAKKNDDGGLFEIIKFALIAIAIVLPIRMFVAQPFIVSGTSMVPTFVDGEYIIVDQLSYRINEPSRGDVVIFKFPEDPKKYFIKRLIGLPGDTVRVTDEKVMIYNEDYPDGLVLDEPYIDNVGNSEMSSTLEEGEYFVMGDNRASSYDSRFWGPLPEKYIIGRALVRLLPVEEIGILPGDFKY